MKEESEKVGLKLSIQKTKILASGPITSWQINGETMEIVTDFIFWAQATDPCLPPSIEKEGAAESRAKKQAVYLEA